MKRPGYLPRPKPERRRPDNEAEGALFDELTADGWEVFKRGYPDFVCVRNGKVMFVEVKPNERCGPKIDQRFVMQVMADAGLNVAMWDPDRKFRRVTPSQKDSPTQ